MNEAISRTLIAYYRPNWKHVQLRSTSIPIIISENDQIDPLIRSEVDKYYDLLYHRGETHSYGLLTVCIAGGECGRNLLPSFHEANYGLCHNNTNRFNEPLEFFQSMHRHYLRIQIYKFSNDLDLIIKQLEHDLDIRLGTSYICIIFILILTFICFLTSSTVEIKTASKFDEDEKINEQNPILTQAPPIERFVPSEQIRFTRQTKV
ncbi:unnamed protein product [Rotaria sp. Silwood1]|nr:unnamed protein product [Rotaria sp. Silwood1]CAF4685313.1 unnamed protein product [Rotaria sp. Silwood1]